MSTVFVQGKQRLQEMTASGQEKQQHDQLWNELLLYTLFSLVQIREPVEFLTLCCIAHYIVKKLIS